MITEEADALSVPGLMSLLHVGTGTESATLKQNSLFKVLYYDQLWVAQFCRCRVAETFHVVICIMVIWIHATLNVTWELKGCLQEIASVGKLACHLFPSFFILFNKQTSWSSIKMTIYHSACDPSLGKSQTTGRAYCTSRRRDWRGLYSQCCCYRVTAKLRLLGGDAILVPTNIAIYIRYILDTRLILSQKRRVVFVK